MQNLSNIFYAQLVFSTLRARKCEITTAFGLSTLSSCEVCFGVATGSNEVEFIYIASRGLRLPIESLRVGKR